MATQNKKASLTPAIQSKIDAHLERIGDLLSGAMEAIKEAAEIYVETIDRYDNVDIRALVAERMPQVSKTFWRRLEATGRGGMDHRLVYGASMAHRHLERLPADVQRKALDHGVEVLTDDGETLLIPVERLLPAQCRMVFSREGMRDIAEQRAWLENAKLSQRVHRMEESVKIDRKNRCVWIKGERYTAGDLAGMLKELS